MHSTLRHAFGLALFMRHGVTTWISKSSHGWRADVNVGSALKNGEKGRQTGRRARERRRWKERDGETADGRGRESDKFLSVIMDTSKASRVFNEDHPPTASHRR